jgi:hypothetical protein
MTIDSYKLATPPEYDEECGYDEPLHRAGYISGQHDALTWLTYGCPDDASLAAFDEHVQMRASLVCLAHNLAIAAALCKTWQHGYWTAHDGMYDVPDELIERWEPGCGRPTP